MPKRDEFKPGFRNIYLIQAPREDNGEQTLQVVSYRGRKSDKMSNMPFSLQKNVHFALLDQVQVDTQDELLEAMKRHHELWIRPYDLSPAKRDGEAPAGEGKSDG